MLALIFEQIGEDVPRSRCGVAAVARRFQHPFHVEVFDGHQVVLPSIVVREFVQEITPLALDLLVALSNTLTLLLPVVRPVLFAREVPLLSFNSVAFFREIR